MRAGVLGCSGEVGWGVGYAIMAIVRKPKWAVKRFARGLACLACHDCSESMLGYEKMTSQCTKRFIPVRSSAPQARLSGDRAWWGGSFEHIINCTSRSLRACRNSLNMYVLLNETEWLSLTRHIPKAEGF